MKNYELIINCFAEDDLISSVKWYDEQREGLGIEFLSEVKRTIKRIEQNPEQFPKYKPQIRKAIVDRFPFTIFFYIEDEVVNVFAIYHFSRNPKVIDRRYN